MGSVAYDLVSAFKQESADDSHVVRTLAVGYKWVFSYRSEFSPAAGHRFPAPAAESPVLVTGVQSSPAKSQKYLFHVA